MGQTKEYECKHVCLLPKSSENILLHFWQMFELLWLLRRCVVILNFVCPWVVVVQCRYQIKVTAYLDVRLASAICGSHKRPRTKVHVRDVINTVLLVAHLETNRLLYVLLTMKSPSKLCKIMVSVLFWFLHLFAPIEHWHISGRRLPPATLNHWKNNFLWFHCSHTTVCVFLSCLLICNIY